MLLLFCAFTLSPFGQTGDVVVVMTTKRNHAGSDRGEFDIHQLAVIHGLNLIASDCFSGAKQASMLVRSEDDSHKV